MIRIYRPKDCARVILQGLAELKSPQLCLTYRPHQLEWLALLSQENPLIANSGGLSLVGYLGDLAVDVSTIVAVINK